MDKRQTQGRKRQAQSVDPIDRILDATDLNWVILKTPIAFTPLRAEAAHLIEVEDQSVLYRSDNHQKLAIVPSSHRPWQPREVLDFYFSLSAFYGLALESVGHVEGGRRLWGLLNTGCSVALPRDSSATMYLLLGTRCDSPLAAQATAVCILEPGAIAVPASIGEPASARIARSFEFLTPADLAEIGELMHQCVAFPDFLEELSCRSLSDVEIKRATAATFGTRRNDPEAPSAKALQAIVKSLDQPHDETTALDLVYALASLSDARDRQRWSKDLRGAAWFGSGFKRKRLAIRSLARILRPCLD